MDDPTQPAEQLGLPLDDPTNDEKGGDHASEALESPRFIYDHEANAYERWLRRCMP